MTVERPYAVDAAAALPQYSDMVYKIALSQTKKKYDAEDVFQEVFLRLVKHSGKINSEEHLKAWLIRVTLNCCKKHFRIWNAGPDILNDAASCMMPEEHDVYYAVLELPRKYRTVIHLFYYEELSVREIGAVLKVKETTVKSQLFRARGILRERLKEGFGDDE